MGDAFVSYVRQPGFPAILAFIIFYRFGEAMIFAMAALFILDKRELPAGWASRSSNSASSKASAKRRD